VGVKTDLSKALSFKDGRVKAIAEGCESSHFVVASTDGGT